MKKFMNLLVLGLALFLPFSVNAATSASTIVLNSEGQIDCNPVEGKDNVFKCEVKVDTTGDTPAERLAVSITEHNATVDKNSITPGGDWTIAENNYPIIAFESLGATGQYTLFTFEYQKATDGTDCYVSVNLVNPGADNKDTPTEPTPDTPEENKQTGMTLPYVVLGGAVLLAGYAFVSTKNKSKLHKI